MGLARLSLETSLQFQMYLLEHYHAINKVYYRPPDKSAYWTLSFYISYQKNMLWVLKRTVSMRRFF